MNRVVILPALFVAAAAFAGVCASAAFADDAAPVAAAVMAPPPPAEDRCLGEAADRSWWCTPPVECAPCATVCAQDPLFRIPCLDDCVDSFEKGKEASCFKLGASAYNWFNYQNTGDNDFTYGYPTAKGTYFYQFTGDFECCTNGTKFGAHAALRARDQSTFRSFFEEKVWFYEIYGWFDAG